MLLDDWKKYLSNPKDAALDPSDFLPLLTDIEDPVTPEEAFDTFPQGNALAKNCRELTEKTKFNGLYYLPDPACALPPSSLIDLAKEQMDSIEDYLRAKGNLDEAQSLGALKIAVETDEKKFREREEDTYQHGGLATVSEGISDAIFAQDERLWGVEEIAMGLTMDRFVTYHILCAQLQFPVSFRAGFDLYIGGGELGIFWDGAVLLIEDRLA